MANPPRTGLYPGARSLACLLIGVGCVLWAAGCAKVGVPALAGARAEENAATASPAAQPAADQPVITATDPPDQGRNVTLYQEIKITWSKPMNAEATEQAVTIQPAIPFGISWEEQGKLMIIHPEPPGFYPAPGSALYAISVTTQAMSEDGFHMAKDYVLSFFTVYCFNRY